MIRHPIRSLTLLTGLVAAIATGCTVEVESIDDSAVGGKGGKTSNGETGISTTAGGSAGGTAGLGGVAGGVSGAVTSNVAGAGTVPEACGGLTKAGKCLNDVLSYCDNDVAKSVDCASVGSLCQVVGVTATCLPEARDLSCGELTRLGTCDGAKIRYCDQTGLVGVPREIDCAAYGQLCNSTADTDGGALCVPQGACPADVTENGSCSGNHLLFCEGASLFDFDCGLDECKAVGGFADCFMAEVATGCGTETASGRCDGQTRIACMGSTIVREDCEAVGLECRPNATGVACQASANCLASCPNGYACTNGRCSPSTTPAREWTVAVYLVGNNNLSDGAWLDLNEMESIGSSDSLAIAVEAEFSAQYSNLVPSVYQGPTYRFLVEKDADPVLASSLAQAKTLGATNMSEASSLTSFIRWAAETYPAKHFALVLWDHGAGFQGGFVDESAGGNDFLTLKEIAGGIAGSGVHPDLVAFDACLMGMHEVALALRGVSDWMAASEEIEPGAGYPYDHILAHLQQTPDLSPQLLGSAIVDEYQAYYAASTRARPSTQSLVDLSKSVGLEDQLASFATVMSAHLSQSRLEVLDAFGSSGVMRFRMRDLADLGTATAALGGVSGAIGIAATSFGTAYQSSGVVARTATAGGVAVDGGVVQSATGLGLFFPQTAFSATDLQIYRQETDFLPLQPWYTALANLRNNTSTEPVPGTGAVDAFSLVLSWANSPDGNASGADLDLYVYEPNGDFAVAVNGTTSQNGLLSGDSYDTGVPSESYQLKFDHEPGTYIVLVHFYEGPAGESAYPRLQLFRSDLPGGSRTYVRGRIADRVVTEIPMSNEVPLTKMIDESNFAGVQHLDYSNIWYAFTVEVK